MNKKSIEDLNKLKTEIERDKNKIKNISSLIKHEIDRDFFDMFVEEKLESANINSMNKTLTKMKNFVNPKPISKDISSHRNLTGIFIVFAKKLFLKTMVLYTNTILSRQKTFNETDIDFKTYSIENQKELFKKLEIIKERLEDLENSIDDLSEKIKDFSKESRDE